MQIEWMTSAYATMFSFGAYGITGSIDEALRMMVVVFVLVLGLTKWAIDREERRGLQERINRLGLR